MTAGLQGLAPVMLTEIQNPLKNVLRESCFTKLFTQLAKKNSFDSIWTQFGIPSFCEEVF